MDLRKFISFCVLASLCVATPAFAASGSSCTKLTRNLKVGMSGPDVKVMQQILNKNSATKIAESGPGSPGQESEYFGKKTTLAMIRFQEIYKNEVLTPAGLTKGTGFVGSLSRAKLNALCTNSSSSASSSAKKSHSQVTKKTSIPTAVTLPQDLIPDAQLTPQKANVFVPMKVTNPWMGDGKYPTPEIVTLSDTLMVPGGVFTLYGVGFTGDTPNTLHIGDKFTITNLGVDNTGIITFTVPTNVPKGRNYVWVSNAKGVGNKNNFVIVPTPGRDGPTVRIGVPSSGKGGAVVTVFGTGFSTKWNDIHFPTKIISGVKSTDGKTLSFIIPFANYNMSPEDMKRIPDIVSAYYVVNDYGISGEVPFTVKFK
jgi:peptidoglycan hydrolase-like protein with peptidoglycan-binding domain